MGSDPGPRGPEPGLTFGHPVNNYMQGSTINHIQILPFSTTWWVGVVFAFLFVSYGIVKTKNIQNTALDRLALFLGVVLFAEVLATHLYLIFIENTWSLQDSLPLHLCRISVVMAGLALITQKQTLYEWTVYLGLPCGLHSILTPEFAQGNSLWMMTDYYFTRTMLLFVPVFLSFTVGKVPRRKAVAANFIYANIFVVIIFPLNLILGSNYMYLLQKPVVKNPFLIGEWPWYILGLEIAGIMHMVFLDVVFRRMPNYRKDTIVS